MSKYSVVIHRNSPAARAISQLQPPIRKEFWAAVEELRANPLANSQRVLIMGVACQAFRFRRQIGGSFYYFTVVFRFADSEDENTLLVSDVMIREA